MSIVASLALGLLGAAIAGGVPAAIVTILCAMAVGTAARALAITPDRRFVVAAILIGFGTHAAFAMGLDIALFALGRNGALFLDDAGYVQIGADLARAWRGESLHPIIDPSLDHSYVRVVGGVFAVIGQNVAAVKLVNTAFGVLAALLAYRTMATLDLPGRRIALVLMLVFPSLLLWSSLALKDAYVLCFALAAVWGVAEMVRTGRFRWMLLTVGALLAFENVRPYLFVLMSVLWPVSLLFALRARRVLSATVASGIVAVLLISTNALHYLDPNIITAPAYVRRAMALGAKSGFVEPHPVLRALPCDRYVVTVPGNTPVPDPREVAVPRGHEISVVDRGSPNTIIVRAGDLIYVQGATPCPTIVAVVQTPPPPATPPPAVGGTPGPSLPPIPTPIPTPIPSPTPSPAAVVISVDTRNVVSTPAPATEESLAFARGIVANLLHLPVGFAFLVGAPFPLVATSLRDLVSVPEMLLWYVCVIFAVFGVRQLIRGRNTSYAYALLLLAALTLLLSVVEGNVGTLVRHRAMLIPFVVTLAAIGLSHWEQLPARIRLAEPRP